MAVLRKGGFTRGMDDNETMGHLESFFDIVIRRFGHLLRMNHLEINGRFRKSFKWFGIDAHGRLPQSVSASKQW